MAKMEPMEPEGYSVMRCGLENIALLKLFHDLGVDVSQFRDWTVNNYYNKDPGEDILFRGLARIMDVTVYTPYNDKEILKSMVERGELSEDLPETLVIIQDPNIQKSLQTNFEKVAEIVDSCEFDCSDANLIILPSKVGLALLMEYSGSYFELAEGIIGVWKSIKELVKEGEPNEDHH